MNLVAVQYQAIRAVRQIAQRSLSNRQELHRMHSAFGAGLLPLRVEYADGHLWVNVGHRGGFRFDV